MRLQFKGKTPVWAQILTGLLLLNITLQIATAYWIPRWAPIQLDPAHSYPIRYRGGPIFYVQPWLGTYSDYGLYVGIALVVLFFLLLWLNRDSVERLR